jgi:fibronectin type 3 domain-containing protein
MKRITSLFAVVVALAVAVQVAGCGGAADGTGNADNTETTEPVPPSAPSNVSAAAGDAQVTIGWDTVTGAVSYNLYWKNSAGVTTADAVLPEVTPPFVHAGLTNGTAYFYAVTALDANGESAVSSEVSATPQIAVPGAPSNPSATSSAEAVLVGWDAVAGATSYHLYWSTVAGVTKANGTKVENVTAPYTHSQLTDGTAYFYVVTAVNGSGEGEASAQVSATAGHPLLKAFVTTATGTGNLGDAVAWPHNGGNIGVAAGDAVCQNEATAAGLAHPDTFKAWLSDSTTDAYCHVHGFTGKKSDECGQATLPANAGPWYRIDGEPFTGTIDKATAAEPVVYMPVLFDAQKNKIPSGSSHYWTGTQYDGTYQSAFDCNNWTAASGDSSVSGDATMTGAGWSATRWGDTCDGPRHLLCLQTGAGFTKPIVPATGKTVFVSKTLYTGDFGGIAGANFNCNNDAHAAGIDASRTFKAWIAVAGHPAHEQFVYQGPWVRLDGIKVVENIADLTKGASTELLTSIAVDEEGNYVSEANAWTGTDIDGEPLANLMCADFGAGGVNGETGWVTSTSWTWTFTSFSGCNGAERLYCFED